MTRKQTKLLQPWGLYAILDPAACGPRPPLTLAREILAGGAGALQLRDKNGVFEDDLELGRRLQALCDEYGAMFIVNDNPYLAHAIDADGVHIGQTDIPLPTAREIIGPDRIIGLSTHNRDQAQAAQSSGADYLGFGPAYSTATKKQSNPPLGIEPMRWAAATLTLPFVAIGGITPPRAADLAAAGVRNVAAISALLGAKDPQAAASDFAKALLP